MLFGKIQYRPTGYLQDNTLPYTECCRFETESDNTKIAKGINLAESLKELNLSYNGITADTAFALLSSVNGSRAKLQTLRLDNVWVKPNFYKVGCNRGLDVVTLYQIYHVLL